MIDNSYITDTLILIHKCHGNVWDDETHSLIIMTYLARKILSNIYVRTYYVDPEFISRMASGLCILLETLLYQLYTKLSRFCYTYFTVCLLYNLNSLHYSNQIL